MVENIHMLSYLVLSGTLCDIGGKEWQNRKIGSKAPNMTANVYVFHLPKIVDFAEFPRNVEKQENVTIYDLKCLSELIPARHFRRFDQKHQFWHCENY